eukprot:6194716-Pleurochrysis_carterae.AAC.1
MLSRSSSQFEHHDVNVLRVGYSGWIIRSGGRLRSFCLVATFASEPRREAVICVLLQRDLKQAGDTSASNHALCSSMLAGVAATYVRS